MWVAWTGFVFLGALTILPVTSALTAVIFDGRNISIATIQMIKITSAFVMSTVFVIFIFRKISFSQRLPTVVPGRGLVLLGLALWIVLPMLASFEAVYSGSKGGKFVVQNLLVSFFPYVCFLFACGRMLLDARSAGAGGKSNFND
jgi:hypothetical protein